MNSEPCRVERRATQRFDFQLPVCVRQPGTDREGQGFTQDLGARGMLLCTDFQVSEGDVLELTLVMPSEITLGKSMPVRCQGRVLRVTPSPGGNSSSVAIHLENYEYLPEPVSVLSATTPSQGPDDEEIADKTQISSAY